MTVSTIHRAKGTEAQFVVLLACDEELLPSWRSVSPPDPERLAEERRRSMLPPPARRTGC
jgi:DNA helicase-2/ATP-dependent DNA helicase PcrA